jgi:hypothetical protein
VVVVLWVILGIELEVALTTRPFCSRRTPSSHAPRSGDLDAALPRHHPPQFGVLFGVVASHVALRLLGDIAVEHKPISEQSVSNISSYTPAGHSDGRTTNCVSVILMNCINNSYYLCTYDRNRMDLTTQSFHYQRPHRQIDHPI